MERARVILNYNEKGGCGKTTLNSLEGYQLSQKGYRVLMVDFDPQKNMTQMMGQTFNVDPDPLTLFSDGITNYDLSDTIIKLSDNIDIIPADGSLKDFSNKITNLARETRWNMLSDSLDGLKGNYDFIIIDTPPTLNDIVMNAVYAADYVSLIVQTQRLAYNSSIDTISDLQDIKQDGGAHFSFLGVILYLYMKSKVNREVKNDAQQMFEGALYKEPIHFQERVNGFTDSGIKNEGYWDGKVLDEYQKITDELLERIKGDA